MSYAEVAAKGPKQTDEEVSEILHDDSGVHSLASLKSSNDHVQSLKSSYSFVDQQEAAELAQKEEREGQQDRDKEALEARQFVGRVEREAGLLGNETKTTESHSSSSSQQQKEQQQQRYERVKSEAKSEFREIERKAEVGKEKAKEGAKKAEEWADKNKKNPVVVGNAVVITALAGVLGFGAYRLSQHESWSWRVVGVGAGVVGLFAVGDYFASAWLFKKYPPKN